MTSQAENLDNIHRLLSISGGSFSVTSALVLLIISLVSFLRFSKRSSSIPFYGQDPNDAEAPKKRWMSDSINLIEEGYKKFHGAFQLWTTEGPLVGLRPKFIDELKMAPETSVRSALTELLQAKYTMPSLEGHGFLINRLVKLELNKHIPRLIPELKAELDHAMKIEFPVGDDWTPITFHPQVVRLISRMTGRVFVGPKLNRNPEWIHTSVNFTRCAFQSAFKLRTWNPWIRFLGPYFLPELIEAREHNNISRKYIIPIVKQRESAEKHEDYEKPNDAIEWVRDALAADKKDDYEFQSNIQLVFGAVSIHTTGQMVTNVIYDLCKYPEYTEMLWEEIKEVVFGEHGGEFNSDSMNDLKKLDSFMKESQRIGGASPTSWIRRVLKPLTLSDGTQLHKDTLLFAPALAISADPTIYTSPTVFNPLRFYELRQKSPADANKHKFTSTSSTEMHFGGGRHACPGRFFAGHEIKMILCSMLLDFEFRFREGEGRPKSMLFQTQNIPDPKGVVEFRKRRV